MIRVGHIIVGLNAGGAEAMLVKLLSRLDRLRYEPAVLSLTDKGINASKLEALGVRVEALGMSRSLPNPLKILSLIRWLRERRIDLLHTWMYHSDLLGGLAAQMANQIPTIWGVRTGVVIPEQMRSAWYTMKLCSALSHRLPRRVVFASRAGMDAHLAYGYSGENALVIPNGFDLQKFQPDTLARERLRTELGIPSAAFVVGLIARFDPQKDFPTFLAAAAFVAQEIPDCHVLICGNGSDNKNPELSKMIQRHAPGVRLHLLGQREDVPAVTASLDIACLASDFGESFPNVLGEAMACAVPCVTTAVAEAPHIVGQTGRVVRVRDPRAFADAVLDLYQQGADYRRELGERARSRVLELFNLPDIVGRYEALYDAVLAEARTLRT